MSDLLGFQTEEQTLYLEHIRNGMQRGAAAEALGLDRRKVREYISTHSSFLEDVEAAELDAIEHVQEALYQAAINGSVSAARTWLELKGMAPEGGAAAPRAPTAPRPSGGGDPFADLDNVEPLDPRRRQRAE
jgi:hypothetical protein